MKADTKAAKLALELDFQPSNYATAHLLSLVSNQSGYVKKMQKKVHIHLGPHKTGSTSLQRFLDSNSTVLSSQQKIEVILTDMTRQVTDCLRKKDFKGAEKTLSLVAKLCAQDPAKDFILSSEDFAGDLPGRNNARKPYPQLFRNIQVFERAFKGFDCQYYFFCREKDEWIKSAYIQSIKHRNKFKSLNEFCDSIDHGELWEGVLSEAKLKLMGRLHLIEFSSNSGNSTIEKFCTEVGITIHPSNMTFSDYGANRSPDERTVRLLELINSAKCSHHATNVAKKFLLNSELEDGRIESSSFHNSQIAKDLLPSPNIPGPLSKLWERSLKRIHSQDQPDLLPKRDEALEKYRYNIVNPDSTFPEGGRGNMVNQQKILQFRFRGLPEICVLLGMSISYLRRNTRHTERAYSLFHELWIREYSMLLALLPTRWLISSFQTFMEHGSNEDQRMIGSAGFFFGNMMKTYEAERSLEGLPPSAVYAHTKPQTDVGFIGMDRFGLGGTDLMVNTLSMLVELSSKDVEAGRVLQEFLMRLRTSDTIYSRMDQSRISHDINISQFSDCWSFFEKP